MMPDITLQMLAKMFHRTTGRLRNRWAFSPLLLVVRYHFHLQLAVNNTVCGSDRWIAGDSSFNVTIAGIATVTKATGVVQATKFCGDGSCLTGISAGFEQDADGNLFAGGAAGEVSDPSSGSSCFNIFLGCNTGASIASSDHNISLGCKAGCSLSTGCYNIIFGKEAGRNTNSGLDNIFLGKIHGENTTNCGCNVFLGSEAGRCSDGQHNIFLGYTAGKGKSTVSDNTGGCNVNIGYTAGFCITSGCDNVIIGKDTARCIETGCGNVYIGKSWVIFLHVSLLYFVGAEAGKCSDGSFNVAIGLGR